MSELKHALDAVHCTLKTPNIFHELISIQCEPGLGGTAASIFE